MSGNLGFLAIAYSLVYGAIAAYALYLGSRERALREEIQELRKRLDSRGKES